MPVAASNPVPRVIDRLVFIAVKGTALALERTTGAEIWRCELKGSDFVNLHFDGEDLFATTKGEIFCLDPATGKMKWNNGLKGLGYGLVTVATRNGDPTGNTPAMAEHRRRQQQAAAVAAGTAGAAGAGAAG